MNHPDRKEGVRLVTDVFSPRMIELVNLTRIELIDLVLAQDREIAELQATLDSLNALEEGKL